MNSRDGPQLEITTREPVMDKGHLYFSLRKERKWRILEREEGACDVLGEVSEGPAKQTPFRQR